MLPSYLSPGHLENREMVALLRDFLHMLPGGALFGSFYYHWYYHLMYHVIYESMYVTGRYDRFCHSKGVHGNLLSAVGE